MTKKFYKGRPVSSEAVEELLENWPIPNVGEEPEKFVGRSTAFGTPLEELYKVTEEEETAEPEAQEPEFPTLTLEELEQIRQDAFDEGIKQGHEQGYIEGFDKGVSEGKEAGYKEGLPLGKEKGLEEAQPLIEERMQLLSKLVDAIQVPLKQVDEVAEKQLVHLVGLLAEQIILQELKIQPETILHILKKGMDALPIKEQTIQIHLHPEDLEVVLSAYGADHIEKNQWHLVPEPTLDRGGCEIKTPESSIDLTLKTRLADIVDSFLHDSGVKTE